MLRNFGLFRIVFKEYHEDATKITGTIDTYDIDETEDSDIVKGWLFAETGYRNQVDLYFPKDVGKCLFMYLEPCFTNENVSRLCDSLI